MGVGLKPGNQPTVIKDHDRDWQRRKHDLCPQGPPSLGGRIGTNAENNKCQDVRISYSNKMVLVTTLASRNAETGKTDKIPPLKELIGRDHKQTQQQC